MLLRARALTARVISVVPLACAASISDACHGEGSGNRRSSPRRLWQRLDRTDAPEGEKPREREEAGGALGVMRRVNYVTGYWAKHSEASSGM